MKSPALLGGAFLLRGTMYNQSMKRGFSLVELSIVLVILGLLTGGILAGQSLIRASELRSVANDYQRYLTAMHTFRDKYFALPGDFANATKFWTAQDSTPATCRTTSSTTQATCDGNGDGVIGTIDGGTTYSEYFRSWQHLANAGLVEGSYPGVNAAGFVYNSVPGTNVPRSKINTAGFHLVGVVGSTPVSDTTFFEGTYGNFFYFGGNMQASGIPIAVIKPEELWNIDTKLDDGRPAFGKVRAAEASATCHTSTTSATSEYALTTTTNACFGVMMTSM